MTDDKPPKELRARLEWYIEGWGAACVGAIPADAASAVLREAADEIDRLRADALRTRDLLRLAIETPNAGDCSQREKLLALLQDLYDAAEGR